MKRLENKEKKEAKVQAQRGQAVQRSPRTIDIRKFYKENSSSGEEKKVKVGTVSLEFRLFPPLLQPPLQLSLFLRYRLP